MSSAMLPSLGTDSWTEESLSGLAAKITANQPKPLILIDGTAGSGKTALAQKFAAVLDANLVHTDDVSWCADPIDWDGENGGTIESVTRFADWWDSLLLPLLFEEEPWKYVDIIVSGSQSDLSSDKLMVHVPCF